MPSIPGFNFTDVSKLRNFLDNIYRGEEGQTGTEFFSAELQRYLEFSTEQADRYSSWVLTQNSEASADCVSANAYKLIGKWSKGNSNGSAGNLLVSRTESWTFSADLKYENTNESYEGYMSPFGGGYSRPRSSSTGGLWAPSDAPSSPFSLVTIDEEGLCTNRTVELTDPEQSKPSAMLLNNVRFARMW